MNIDKAEEVVERIITSFSHGLTDDECVVIQWLAMEVRDLEYDNARRADKCLEVMNSTARECAKMARDKRLFLDYDSCKDIENQIRDRFGL